MAMINGFSQFIVVLMTNQCILNGILLDFLLTVHVRAAPHECVIRTSQP